MTKEESPTSPNQPTLTERESLQDLIERSVEDTASPNKETAILFAMVDVGFRYGFKMPPEVRKHLKKRIVVHTEVIGAGNIRAAEILSSSLFSSLALEFNEFRGFKEDLGNMTGSWREALHDELLYLGDPDEESAE